MTAVRVLALVIAIGALVAAGASANARGTGEHRAAGSDPFATSASPTAPPGASASLAPPRTAASLAPPRTAASAAPPRTAASTASPAPVATTTPGPSQGVLGTGDPRSNGGGPGLVGAPFVIALGVILLGAIAAGGTLLYVRLIRND